MYTSKYLTSVLSLARIQKSLDCFMKHCVVSWCICTEGREGGREGGRVRGGIQLTVWFHGVHVLRGGRGGRTGGNCVV